MSCSRPRVIVGECGEVPFFGRNRAFPVGKPLQRSHSSECISARSFWLASRPEQWACMDTRCANVGFNFARSPLTSARREGKVKANAASYTDGCAGSVPCRQRPSRYSIVCGKKPSTLRPSSDGSMSSPRYFGKGTFRNVLNAGVFGRRVEVSSLIGLSSRIFTRSSGAARDRVAILGLSDALSTLLRFRVHAGKG
jgi:hypothetical protein